MDRFISIKEASGRYGVSLWTLYSLIKMEPAFPYVNVGLRKKYMIDVEQFEAWLSARSGREKRENLRLSSGADLLARFTS